MTIAMKLAILWLALGYAGKMGLSQYRWLASLSVVLVMAAFSVVSTESYFASPSFIAADDPQETLYHVAKTEGGKLVTHCIHGPGPGAKTVPFRNEREAQDTGRTACRCVRHESIYVAARNKATARTATASPTRTPIAKNHHLPMPIASDRLTLGVNQK